MSIILMMSWRNLWRHRRRSLVVMATVALGVFAMIVSMGIMNGINRQLVENTITTSLGHVALHRAGFQIDPRIETTFTPARRIIEAIEADPAVRAWAPRVKAPAMIRSSETARGVMIVGIDPARERRVSGLSGYTRAGGGSRYLAAADDDALLISTTLAAKMGVSVGDKLVLMVQDRRGDIAGVGMRVAGLFMTPVDAIDRHVVYTGLRHLQSVTGLGRDWSEICLVTTDFRNAGDTQRRIARALDDRSLEVLSWQQMAPAIVRMVDLADNLVLIFMVVIFITVVFTIANTMIMAIMERFHEIGVMKALGTRPAHILVMVVFEAVNLSVLGLAAGLAAGLGVVAVSGWRGIDLSAYAATLRSWGTGSVVHPSLTGGDVAAASLVVIVTALVAALYPAIKAARIKPLEAIHFL